MDSNRGGTRREIHGNQREKKNGECVAGADGAGERIKVRPN
jgi:hypothetical protein